MTLLGIGFQAIISQIHVFIPAVSAEIMYLNQSLSQAILVR